jgi:AcrR family transcriptional regulator
LDTDEKARPLDNQWEKTYAVGAGGEYEHFLKLDPEKQERILAAAFEEFHERGFDAASTNAIVQKAGISKGLLFHYFGSKEGLYQFLMQESAHRIAADVFPALDISGDVFNTIKTIVHIKLEVCIRHPVETDFLTACLTDNLPDHLRRYRETFKGLSYDYLGIVAGMLDGNLLGSGISKEVAAEIIAWVCEKYGEKILGLGRENIEKNGWDYFVNDFDRYLDVLKKGLYK